MIHILGFIIISFGIVGVIYSRLGASPIDAFNYFVWTLTPLTLGTVVILTGLSVTLLAFIFNRSKDMILSLVFLFLVGGLIDGWKFIFDLMPAGFYDDFVFRLILATISLFMMAFGVAITLTTGLATSPYEQLMMILNKKIHSIQFSKMIIEGTFFTLAVIMGLITNQLFDQVNVFTLLLVLLNGPLVSIFLRIINKNMSKKAVGYAI